MSVHDLLDQKRYHLRLCISNQLDLLDPNAEENVWNNAILRRHYIDNDAEIFSLKMDMWKFCEIYDLDLPTELHEKK